MMDRLLACVASIPFVHSFKRFELVHYYIGYMYVYVVASTICILYIEYVCMLVGALVVHIIYNNLEKTKEIGGMLGAFQHSHSHL